MRVVGEVTVAAGGEVARGATSRVASWVVGAGIVLVAVNLRPAVTSFGALLDEVQRDVGLSGVAAGFATTLPVLAFATVGAFAPLLARRVGLVASMVVADLTLAAGLALRAATASAAWSLLLWTGVATAGIAVANVLLPSLVRQYFPHRLGLVTGLYTMALQVGSAAAAGLTVPLAGALGGWRAGLGVWTALALVALLPWAWALWRRGRGGGVPEAAERAAGRPGLARSPLAWALAVLFGMQALGAYVVMGWLPEIYRDAGLAPGTAGVLLAVVMGVAAPMALLLPTLANRWRDQRVLVAVVTTAMALGYVGLALAPAGGAWLWAVLLGVGSGAFPLALSLIGLRARSAATTTALSAFAQSVGYLLAVAGPLVIGALHAWTQGWMLPLGLLLVLLAPQLVAGLIAGRDRHVDDEGSAARTPQEPARAAGGGGQPGLAPRR